MSYAYHIIKNGEEKGPFTFNELIRQHLDIDTRVLSPGASNWEDACLLRRPWHLLPGKR
jgi:hypothetical protein